MHVSALFSEPDRIAKHEYMESSPVGTHQRTGITDDTFHDSRDKSSANLNSTSFRDRMRLNAT